jgi:hypothetical protein
VDLFNQIRKKLVQEPLRNGHVKILGYQFGAKFKLVFCAKYDRGLDLGFWKILKPLKCFLPETSDINKAKYFI